MNYFLFELAFDTPVHFGSAGTAQSLSSSEDHICADTLFSALCHTALQMDGEAGLEELCTWARRGELLLSDTMPWCGEDYYLPKPYFLSDSTREVPARTAKAMKKLRWVPVRAFSAFSESIHGGTPYDPAAHPDTFGIQAEVTKAYTPEGEDALPYQVGLFRFKEDCGLYVLVALERLEQEEQVSRLFRALGMSGVGGKVSSGYGKFHVEDKVLLNEAFDDQTEWLFKSLTEKGTHSLLLTTSLPREEELDEALEGAYYQLARRSGFVSSESYSDTAMKKRAQYFLIAGSVMNTRFTGDLYQVGGQGTHPVYRYGKPLFLGVEL